jgi:hypothetical protein
MSWFISHVYIAAWVSPVIALIGLLIRNGPKSEHRTSWTRVMVNVAFLTCLAAVLTPGFDLPARYFAGTMMSFILGYFLVGGLKD